MSSSSSPQRSSARARPAGVSRPPGGLGRAAALGWSALVILLGAGLLFWIREPLAESPWGPPKVRIEAPAPATAPIPETTETAVPVEVKVPSWSLVRVGDAIHEAVPSLQALIEEGRAEVPELSKNRASKNATQSERAARRWRAWGRIWKNRVAVVEGSLPPPEACAVHAAMDPACRIVREATVTLRSVADAEDKEAAEETFARTEEILDRYLNPPEPLPLPEEERTTQ